jgi:phosphatidylethanolamine/phosphatidyl-N-methylethanolamine N-methyltransferase
MTNASRSERPTARAETRITPGRGDSLRHSVEFLRGFLRNPAQVGSVIPSSHHLEQRLVQCARAREARTVVELGPGTGGTTAALLKAMPAGAVLLGIELDGDFYRHLRSTLRDPRLLLEQGSAEALGDYLELHGLPAPDAIVSGIPFSTMPEDVSDRIAARAARVLRPGGRFVAYQVRAHVAEFVAPYLGEAEKEWEMVNVPPVRVFTWVKR